MKILHCCLASFYNDNFGYQENILPRMHKIQGHDVMILASTEVFKDKVNLGYIEPKKYINEDGILVHRIPYVSWLPHKLAIKLRLYEGVYEELCSFKPDFIFLHDIQFLSYRAIIRYLKENPSVRMAADGHADFSNSARSFVSRYILHGIIYKRCAKDLMQYTTKFYGTLPARVDFFRNVYGIPENKTALLVMGADDEYVKRAKETNQNRQIREQYKISDDTFLIVSGGKFDSVKKQIIDVMNVVKNLSSRYNVKMLIFGSVMSENGFKEEFDRLCDGEIIQYAGWIKGNESYNFFEAADLVIFPGRHSVLWEQAVGQGKPCIFKYFRGHTHVDLNGNCVFLKMGTETEITTQIEYCINNYEQLYSVAQKEGLMHFSYYQIAHRSIQ